MLPVIKKHPDYVPDSLVSEVMEEKMEHDDKTCSESGCAEIGGS